MESIPGSCKGWSETKAAYRFFGNDLVTAKKVIKPHRMATFQRINNHPVVLLLQDTSVLNYSGQKERPDIGPIQQDNVRGIFLHPMLAVTPNRECLGIVDYEQWSRERLKNQTPKERKAQNRQAKKALGNGQAEFVIRGLFDRTVLEDGVKKRSRLKANVQSSQALGKIQFITDSRNRHKREVTQSIFAKEVTLMPPAEKVKSGQTPVKATVIIATEENPPLGEEPVEWLLLTSIPVVDLETANQVIQWYLCRWQVEIFFKILKSGCKIEKIQLNEKQRYNPCLAMYFIVAWRILFLTTIGRTTPNLNSECLFDPIEWQTAFVMIHKKPPPKKSPPLKEMLGMVAKLGGFLGRKSDGDPGPIVMWKCLQSLYEYIRAREVFEIAFNRTYG